MRTFFGFLTAAILAGCVPPPADPIPVLGDIQEVTGQWSGTYSSNETGRSGSIQFNLVAGADTARGDVLMIPNWPGPYSISQYVPPEEPARPAQLLRIKLVRVFGHQVAGQLDPYQDPDCNCEVLTIFSGRIEGNSLIGVYYSYRPDGRALSGEWRVERKVSHVLPRD
jgi:hypothetical protein